MPNQTIKEIRERIDSLIKKSHATDVIHLTRQDDLEIMSIWDVNLRGKTIEQLHNAPPKISVVKIPSDLLIMNTIPIMDCKFEVDERDSDIENGAVAKFRVCVFDEENRIRLKDTNGTIYEVVGSLEVNTQVGSKRTQLSIPFTISPGSNIIMCNRSFCKVGVPDKNNDIKMIPITDLNKESAKALDPVISYMFKECLSTWYGAQICMLFPPTREIFGAPKITTEQNIRKKQGKTRKHPLLHIKNHYVNSDKLNKLRHGEDSGQKKEWKTLVWYVSGHYRTLKDGRKVWVKPYVKGPLRNAISPELRDRMISTRGVPIDGEVADALEEAKKKASRENKARPSKEKSKSINMKKKKPSIDD